MPTITPVDDGQSDAIDNASGTPPTDTQGHITTQDPTTEEAFQVSSHRDAIVYIAVADEADALTVELGPDEDSLEEVFPSAAPAASLMTVEVPAGWVMMLTGTMGDLTVTSVLK